MIRGRNACTIRFVLKIYNTLTRSIEEFHAINPPHVGMYTCGPTVYDYAHIGNFRTYTTADILLRTLTYNGFAVLYIMNITDVGHLTGDNHGDADTGEDRIEKSAKNQGRSAWDIAELYTRAFISDYQRLNLTQPEKFVKATDHIKEQITMVEWLGKKGFTYKISDGIYFDTSKFPDYGKLSNLDQIKEGARVEANPEKKNPRDFALWKFSPNPSAGGEARQMEWDSLWGKGFPGWHIECSAMSMKYLGETFDIHTGGIDLSSTHHPNEIAQSEAATGKQFVNYWVHGAFILIEGKRMSKSLGNNFTVADIVNRGFDPLALRYLYLQTHYRQEMNFTWEALEASARVLAELWDKATVLHKFSLEEVLRKEPSKRTVKAWERFQDAINNDLNTSEALAALHQGLKEAESEFDLAFLLERTDEVFGLSFRERGVKLTKDQVDIQKNNVLMGLLEERSKLRKKKQFNKADMVRAKIKRMGYELKDEDNGTTTLKKIR